MLEELTLIVTYTYTIIIRGMPSFTYLEENYYKTVERGDSSNGVLVVTRIIWGCCPWIID